MNWSVYSRYVGSVLAPRWPSKPCWPSSWSPHSSGSGSSAGPGLGACPLGLHLAREHRHHVSALFILAANAWMQHPVGYKVVGNRAVMTNFWAVMTTAPDRLVPARLVLSARDFDHAHLGVSAWHLLKDRRAGHTPQQVFATSAKLASSGSVAIVATMFFGDNQARIMEAPATDEDGRREAIYNTQNGASFSLLTIGDFSGTDLPDPAPPQLSVLADNTGTGRCRASTRSRPRKWRSTARELQAHLVGHLLDLPDHGGLRDPHAPLVGRGPVAHAPAATGTVGLVLRFSVFAIALPFVANTTGWTSPRWAPAMVVYGLLKTSQAVSHIGTGYVVTSLVGFTRYLQPAGRDRLRAHGPLRPR